MQKVFKFGLSKEKADYDYMRRAIHMICKSEIEEPKERSGLMWLIFGYESMLSKELFISRLHDDDCNWIFDAKKTRLRLEYFLDEKNLKEIEDQN